MAASVEKPRHQCHLILIPKSAARVSGEVGTECWGIAREYGAPVRIG